MRPCQFLSWPCFRQHLTAGLFCPHIIKLRQQTDLHQFGACGTVQYQVAAA